MLVEQVVRRNRRRIALVTAVALVNYWVLLEILLGLPAALKIVVRHHPPILLAIALCLVIPGLVAAKLLADQLREMDAETLDDQGAVMIGSGELPLVEDLLRDLGIAVGTSPVRAALVADDAPNVLTVGRRPCGTTVVVTSGLVEKLSRDELEAVLAAELWAVRRYDTAMQTVTQACAGDAVATHRCFSSRWTDPRSWLWIAVTFPTMLVAELVRHRLLRDADVGADEMALATIRHPEALREAMVKLRDDPAVVATLDLRTAPLRFEPIPHSGDRQASTY